MIFSFLSAASVLWLAIGVTVLFVVAPHLEIASKPAARTLRFGSIALLLQLVVPFGLYFVRMDPEWTQFIGPAFGALFWGSFALAAWQLVQGAAPKKGGLL